MLNKSDFPYLKYNIYCFYSDSVFWGCVILWPIGIWYSEVFSICADGISRVLAGVITQWTLWHTSALVKVPEVIPGFNSLFGGSWRFRYVKVCCTERHMTYGVRHGAEGVKMKICIFNIGTTREVQIFILLHFFGSNGNL